MHKDVRPFYAAAIDLCSFVMKMFPFFIELGQFYDSAICIFAGFGTRQMDAGRDSTSRLQALVCTMYRNQTTKDTKMNW